MSSPRYQYLHFSRYDGTIIKQQIVTIPIHTFPVVILPTILDKVIEGDDKDLIIQDMLDNVRDNNLGWVIDEEESMHLIWPIN